jgi:hypothetical protein
MLIVTSGGDVGAIAPGGIICGGCSGITLNGVAVV